MTIESAKYLNILFHPMYTENLLMGTLANCEDPDEMPQHVAYHRDQHCLLSFKTIFSD